MSILGVRSSAEVEVRCSGLVIGLAQLERLCDRSQPAVELNLDDVGDVISSECLLLGAVGLHDSAWKEAPRAPPGGLPYKAVRPPTPPEGNPY